MLFRFISFIACIVVTLPLMACATSVSDHQVFEKYTGKSYAMQGTKWHLWWQKGMTRHRGHSKGYVLTPTSPNNVQGNPLYYHGNPENARHIASAQGAKIEIKDFFEHGMDNPVHRATAYITLPDGQSFPCEIEWRPGIEKDIIPIQ